MQNRRLTRSKHDRKIAGVAGGMAEYFSLDPTLVRVAWVLAVIIPEGVGLLAYIILWIVLPGSDEVPPPATGAVRIAEERYARGEITADELARIREDLSR